MSIYFAPLEGLTDPIFRSLHHKYFPGVDRYYTPFLSPTVHRQLTPREMRELPPLEELSYACVPQLLTKMGITLASFRAAVGAEVEKLPKVSGSRPGNLYISQDVDRALRAAEEQAQAMRDEFITVEHLLLG